MTGIIKATQKNLMVFSGRAHPELADEVARELGTDLVPTSAYDFANGEIYVRYEESVRGSDAFVIQSHTAPINQWIMEQLIMVDALKRASAKRITVVLPFYGYARQDKKHRGREPISARLMADLFKQAGADRLMAVDLHTAQIQGFFDGPVDHLMALPILADHVAARYGDQQLAVVSPDAGRIRVAEQWSERLGGVPALTAVMVIGTGIFGAIAARFLFNALRIPEHEVRGFALGVASHGIGTARAFQVSAQMGAFAGLGMGLNGVATALLAPWLVPWVMAAVR